MKLNKVLLLLLMRYSKNMRYFIWIIFFSVFVNTISIADELPKACLQDCANTFGVELGESASGVKAFSNCNNSCVNPEPFFINKTFTGIQWQCVEYARRWLLENKHVVYGDVDIAADIWQLEQVLNPNTKAEYTFQGFVNGSQDVGLERGDLLIYSKEFYGTGHVAVVLNVDDENVYVGEQNFNNQKWQGDYARAVPYINHENHLWLLDAYLIGWKRVISQ